MVSTVGQLAKNAKRSGLRAPAVVVVGNVVGLRRWVGKQSRGSLAGQRVVLTVSESLGKGWRELFESHGAEVWEIPMTKIAHLKPKVSWRRDVEKSKWLVFTSGAGVRALPGITGDVRKLAGKQIGRAHV